MENENLYKYQIETLQELDKIPEKLETRTNEKYLILISDDVKYTYFNMNNYITVSSKLYLAVNAEDNFIIIDDLCGDKELFNLTQILNNDIKIKFNKNVFLNINKTIDRIIKDNAAREAFHEKLNYELQALNKNL